MAVQFVRSDLLFILDQIEIAERNAAGESLLDLIEMLRRLRGWRCLIRTRRMAELTPFLRAPVVDDADPAINQKNSDNNEVRPRFSGRDN